MDTAGESTGSPAPVAFDFPIWDPSPSAPPKIPRRIRRRLLDHTTAPCTVDEIEAKLKEATLRRQQFHEWLSSKARPKQRSTSSASREEDVGQRIQAKLYAAEQKRLSLLAKAQMRLARLDERRQAAKTDLEMRFQKERQELGTRVESRVQQAEANRMRLMKAHMQRLAESQERAARSLLQRAVRENKYRECIHSAIVQKRAGAEKKRMGLLEAEKMKARARFMQACRVAKTICAQREVEQRGIQEQSEKRLQKRDEHLKQGGSTHSSSGSWNEQGEYLSVQLARCWRRFLKSRKTTVALAKAFVALKINQSSVKSTAFERFALCIESATTLQTLKALLDRLETRFLLSQSSSSSSLENIDHLLKRLTYPNRTSPPGKATRTTRPAKRGFPKETRSSESIKLPRYPVRFVLCAYMILGHPTSVFSGHEEREVTLRESAETFIREFELLIKIVTLRESADVPSRGSTSESTETPKQHTFRGQLAAFDTAWRSYIYDFVVWKVKDARSLEEDLVRAACQLELSMMQKCKLNAQRQTELSDGEGAIRRQVAEDQKLLREKVLHLSGVAGIERMEGALSDTRSKIFQAKESRDPFVGLVAHKPSPPLSISLTQPPEPFHKEPFTEKSGESQSVTPYLFGSSFQSMPNFTTEVPAVEVHSTCATGEQRPTENELLVNEILHAGIGTIYHDHNAGDANDIKAKVKATMENAFWDGITESLKQDEPDYGRIVKLVKEVRDQLCEVAPQSWKQEIIENFDLDILSQVLKSGTQDTYYLGRTLEHALVMLQRLSAPANEAEMKKAHEELQTQLAGITQSDDKSHSSFVLATVMGLRFVLEKIQILKKEISKTRIQLMEPIIKGSAGFEYLQKAFADRYGHSSSSANFLPLTVRWISSLGTRLEEEWVEHTNSLSASSVNNGSTLVTVLRTGGRIPSASKESSPLINVSGGGEQRECNGNKVDILVRLGLLELASRIEGLTIDTVPETFKLNALRLRAVQSQFQQIIVLSTSMLVLRQTLISSNVASTPYELESTISGSFKKLSARLERVADPGIEEIVDALADASLEERLQGSKEVMGRMLARSLQSNDAVFMKVSRVIYLASRGVVFGGSGDQGRRLADASLQRVGSSMLMDLVVKAAEALIVMADISLRVHEPWYLSLLN